jgi:hypothetical protein
VRGRCPVCEIRGHIRGKKGRNVRLCGFCGEYFEVWQSEHRIDREIFPIYRELGEESERESDIDLTLNAVNSYITLIEVDNALI